MKRDKSWVPLTQTSLEEWFLNKKVKHLPPQHDYVTMYKSVKSQLENWVHPYVNYGNMMNDEGYLTDHGPGHIQKIIQRISSFVYNNQHCDITHFELLILLLAVHIHDVGNIFERQKHEFSASKIIKQLGTGVAGQDQFLWNSVFEIAKAHKGYNIEHLNVSESFLSFQFRPQLLAAILKFADELAEDSSRADQFNLVLNNIRRGRPQSEIYHQYAKCLVSLDPDVKARAISFNFSVDKSLIKKKFPKKEKRKVSRVYLIDEIYSRILKTFEEKMYCLKFLRPYFNFDQIKVSISIVDNHSKIKQINYQIDDGFFVKFTLKEFLKLRPEIAANSGKNLAADKKLK